MDKPRKNPTESNAFRGIFAFQGACKAELAEKETCAVVTVTNNGAAAEQAALTYLLYDGTATKSIVLSLSDTVIGSSKLR